MRRGRDLSIEKGGEVLVYKAFSLCYHEKNRHLEDIMAHIDEKFKECDPKATVEKIQSILASVGVRVQEKWIDSGVDHCWSLNLSANYGTPLSNGKGVTAELARASAYGEFIERMQCGLFLYKNQSILRGKDMSIHSYAPDGKYMTVQELIEQGDWMDHIIAANPGLNITRYSIAEHCRAYACADDGKILTLPFYSLLEGKHVYLPAAFVEQIYTTNGCCAGNARAESWVHALSEILERYCNQKLLTSGKAAPVIPLEQLRKYPTVASILDQIEAAGEFDVTVFDYSQGLGFPVLATRIISRKTHKYRINVAADPVFEIAVQRTLTEMFQGKRLDNLTDGQDERILAKVTDFPARYNIINQLENGTGLYTADYFANELTCKEAPATFPDNSGKTNKELLEYVLSFYKKLGRPVYVRNYSFLGFHTYKFVVPGISETRAQFLADLLPEYAIGDEVSKTLRDPANATDEDLQLLLQYSQIRSASPRFYGFYARMAGPPLSQSVGAWLIELIRSYCAYRLKDDKKTLAYLRSAIAKANEEVYAYLSCVAKYLELKIAGVEPEKIRSILQKFYQPADSAKLYGLLGEGKTPFDDFLPRCDYASCEQCQYADRCSYRGVQGMIRSLGKIYSQFTDGQNPETFKI